jgi:hypothetical protein
MMGVAYEAGCGMYIPSKLKKVLRRQLEHSAWFRRWNGERLLRLRYNELHGRALDLKTLNTFSEKLFASMILINRGGKPTYTRLSDKYLVRDYVRKKIGDEHLVRLLWHGTNPFGIPFDSLPQKYIIKPNHLSGKIITIDGNSDRNKIIDTLQLWLNQNLYWVSREYQYFDISPRIMVEEFIEDGVLDHPPLDYRFWCFNGVAEVIQVDNHAHSINPFYDTSWNKLDLHYREKSEIRDVGKPKNFDQMLTVATKLSEDFDFVRVDLYNANGQTLFGELTFTPVAGHFRFKPESWDLRLGQKWRI